LVRLAVVGAGGWGKNHLRVLHDLGHLVAFCEIDIDKRRTYEEKYGIKGYASFDEMVSREKLDGVTICTPTVTHFSVAKEALLHGLHTFVEKPLTSKSYEGERLVELSKSSDLFLTVGFIERFNPAVSQLKSLVEEKRIGETLLLEFHRENKWLGTIKDVGIIEDTAVHDIDTARWIFEKEPYIVFARAGNVLSQTKEDFAIITLGFSENKSAFIMSNWVTPKRIRTLTTVCTGGVVTLDFITQELRIDDEKGTTIPRRRIEEPLMLELKAFAESIEKRQPPLVTPEDGLNTTRIAEAASASAQSNAPIFLNLN
jgi:UDP-N-acetylglucosamine 3-dehydrogenase